MNNRENIQKMGNKNIQEVEKKNSHRGGGKTRTEHGGD